MSISISTAQFAPKNKQAEVDGVLLIVRPQTSDFAIKALETQAEAKSLRDDDPKILEKAKKVVDDVREQALSMFVNREAAEKVFEGLDVQVITAVYKEVVEKGEDVQ